jgi:hypothetical protein
MACKECRHDLSKDCVNANCICCKEGSHSMVLDGMAGFEPPRQKKDEDQSE